MIYDRPRSTIQRTANHIFLGIYRIIRSLAKVKNIINHYQIFVNSYGYFLIIINY